MQNEIVKHGLRKKVLSISSFQLAGMVVSLINSIITARWLGPEGRGILTISFLLPQLIGSLGLLGLFEAIVFAAAKKDSNREAILSIALAASIVFGILYALVLSLIYPFIKENILKGVSFAFALPAFLSVPFIFLRNSISQFLFGIGEIWKYNIIEFSFLIMQLAGSIILIVVLNYHVTGGIYAILIAYIMSLILSVGLASNWVLLSVRRGINRHIIRTLWSYGLRSFAGSVAQKLNYRLDMFLVNYFLGTSAVGIYGVSARIAELALFFPRIIRMVRFAEISANGSHSEQMVFKTSELFRKMFIFIICTFPIYAVVAAFGIDYLYGSEFHAAIMPMYILLIGSGLLSLSMVIFAHVAGSGKPQLTSKSSWIALLFTLCFDYLLIPWVGIKGAAFASLIAYGVYLTVLVWFIKRTAEMDTKSLVPSIRDIREMLRLISER